MRAVSMIVFGKTVIQSKNEQMRKTFKVFRIFLRMTYNGGDRMRCLRCGNTQQKYFYQDGSVWYCRKCIAFGRMNVGELPRAKKYRQQRHACDYVLKYPLTPKQQKASAEIVWHAKHQQSQLVYAVCGAGKTELVMEVIKQFLNAGKKVGFAISRRQVVLEIATRMKEAFPMIEVIAVCEGYSDICDGDLIVCTMHQLYRYYQTFDLLIMDEVDAFPYRGNEVLQAIAQHACRGVMVYLTATPDESMLKDVEDGKLALVELFERPHGYPLIEPEIRTCANRMQLFYLIAFLYQQRKAGIQTLVFVPTIRMANELHKKLCLLFRCKAFTSQSEDKEKIVDDFHKKKYECLITTTILERGITIKGIYIIILQADHVVFNEASLTQIIGRVGRSIEMPSGKGIFLCERVTRDIERCKHAIQHMNKESFS